jgi:hypothetical protein
MSVTPAQKRYRTAHRGEINAYKRALRAKNPEKVRAEERARRNRRRETNNAQQRARYAANPGKHRKYSLKKVYWTVEDYRRKKEEQEYRCALCNVLESALNRELNGDHDHHTLQPRGLLCGLCNTALERLDSVPGWAEKAVQYLQRYALDVRNHDGKMV